MSSLGLIYHPDYLKHVTGSGHPERSQRLEVLVQHLLSTPFWGSMTHLRPSPAPAEFIHLVHPERHTSMVKIRCQMGEHILDDGDTHVCKDSYDISVLAAGGVVQAIDEVVAGTMTRAFCAVRPPGHHAESSKVMGFCLFNNVAIGARYAQKKYGVERIAIVDWDVHHGNGTQQIFYDDDSVLFISLHQFPFYPGTGAASERGSGRGEGFTLNCPMGAGSVEKDYLDAFQAQVLPALHRFQPQLLMISAGFDAHTEDPIAGINLKDESYRRMTELLLDISGKYCGGKVVSVLEGGYNVEALARSVECHLKAML
ncbi:MAG: histone deacetylase [Ignavibacteriales bacterium]|nr:histone deacetylase [Ignavibacteriales bacterium]